MWAIIGGSGFEKFEGFEVQDEFSVDTPFGEPSAQIQSIKISGQQALFLSRHGKKHEYTPSHINYRANIFALKKSGANKLLSLSAVGSLRKELAPGDCVVPTQFIDRTKSVREVTFCEKGVVGHVSLAHPVSVDLAKQAKEILKANGFKIHFDKTAICMEGPAFSTQAESHWYRQMGADIIGMTSFPEYALAREAGMHYLPLSFVTDYDSWDDAIAHVTLEQVIEVMRNNNHKAFELLKQIIPPTAHFSGCSEQGLKTGLLTPLASLPKDIQEWMQILVK
ncbi:MAG: MTAP family purine nucleoside phosphorylase [Proteobacteria bacterium]|nr:MTAP family purine nucleoside phosphorylase [Pseudomonadota bacterium]